ncbi:carbohydrate kinase family protein [Halomarina ordinaria]|uniref:Carbohydrate kinase family protein n=1 Tax=Halomarina ordinaria TaxID=3033939 RepID=A0ABD5U3J6_9EURY|nr:PfkB family carbohydrate kinase [Halomarina sp. PSRA2]
MRVVCAGHVNWDVTLFVDALPGPDAEATIRDRREGGGGSAANVATHLARLDVDVGLVGSVGDDRDGVDTREELVAAGVDTRGVRVVEGMTAVKYLLVTPDGETYVLGTHGVNESYAAEHVPGEYLARADYLHLTGQHPETAARLAERAREAGLRVSFDPGRRLSARDYSAALSHADVVFLNSREAEQRRERVPDQVVVTKHGAGGATVESPDGRVTHPGYPVEAVDSTGAGDAFAAGFLAALLDDGDYARALAVANACGALVASAPGTRPTLDHERLDALVGSDVESE